MPRADPEVIREIADRRFVEKASLDQPHGPRDGGSRAVPCRAPRRCFGPAAQTWSKARSFGGGGGRKKNWTFWDFAGRTRQIGRQ
jgi:hypothetical protein